MLKAILLLQMGWRHRGQCWCLSEQVSDSTARGRLSRLLRWLVELGAIHGIIGKGEGGDSLYE